MKPGGDTVAKESPGSAMEVATPVGDPPARVYRRAFRLNLATGGTADAIVVDPQETTLTASFESLVYDVLDPPDAGLAAGLAGEGDGVIVALDGPRRVRRVRVEPAANVALHRLDGDNAVEDPTVTGGNGFLLADEFTDRRFVVRLVGGGSLAPDEVETLEVLSYPTGPRAGVAAPDAAEAAFFWRASGEIGKPSQAGDPAASPPLSAGVVDEEGAFALELQRYLDGLASPLPAELELDLVLESDAPCGVRNVVPSVEYRLVASSFGGPLYGLGDVKDATALARALADGRDPVSQHVHGLLSPAGRKLVEAAEPGAAALVAELNALVTGPSVYDDDAFARVNLPAETRKAAQAGAAGATLERLNRALLDAAYPDALAAPAEKRVLRFAGERAEIRELTIRLPSGATVAEATLTTVEALRADRPVGGNGFEETLHRSAGVTVGGTTSIAAATVPTTPLVATGIALALLATTERAELLVQLREDWGGTPAGRTLAESSLVVDGLGVARRITALFADPVALSALPYWIIVRAVSGGAVWLADAAADDIRVLESAAGSPRGQLSDVRPVREILSRSAELQVRPAVSLQVGGRPVVPAPSVGDERTYELAPALNAYLMAQSWDGPVEVPLVLTASAAGLVIVQPPTIVYELD